MSYSLRNAVLSGYEDFDPNPTHTTPFMRGVEVAKKTIVKVWRYIFGDNRKPKPYEMYNRMNKINAPSYRKKIINVMCVENRPIQLF